LPGWLVRLVEHRAHILAVFTFTAIVVGGVLHLIGRGAAGQTVWAVAVAALASERWPEYRREPETLAPGSSSLTSRYSPPPRKSERNCVGLVRRRPRSRLSSFSSWSRS
jgi:hypothetical protein